MTALVHIKDVKLAAGGANLTNDDAELKALKEAYYQESARREYPNIPHVLAVNGSKITMTRVEGVSLIKYIFNGGYKYRDALIATLVGIINAIHKSGIIHADYGPHNVIIDTNSSPCIIDFGESVIPCRNIEEMEQDDINEMISTINTLIAYIYLGGVKIPPQDMTIITSMVPYITNEINSLRDPEAYARIQRYITRYM